MLNDFVIKNVLLSKESSIYDVLKDIKKFLDLLPQQSKKTIDLLFKSNRICKNVTNVRTPSPLFSLEIINVQYFVFRFQVFCRQCSSIMPINPQQVSVTRILKSSPACQNNYLFTRISALPNISISN